MMNKTFAATAVVVMALMAGSSAQASTLLVNFSDLANVSLTAAQGDSFSATGLSGSVTLTGGVAQSITSLMVSWNNSTNCCYDNQVYSTLISRALVLNGVSQNFTQTWDVTDNYEPLLTVGPSLTAVYVLPEGTISVKMDGTTNYNLADNDFWSGVEITLYPFIIPEPATWAMFLAGFGAIGFMMRGSRRKTAAVTA